MWRKEQFSGLNLILNLAFFTLILSSLLLMALDFKIYGDIFRFILPLCCVALPFYRKDFEALKGLIFAFLFSSFVVYAIKFCIVYLVTHYNLGDLFAFAMRPINEKFSGFPSGHTQGAFVGFAFAFVYFRIHWKVLFFCLAILVGISRVYSEYHTILQVICGGLIGFFVSYLIIKNQILKK